MNNQFPIISLILICSTEFIQIAIADGSQSLSIQDMTNSQQMNPDNMQLNLQMNSDKIFLNLTKNQFITSDAMVVVGLNGNPKTNSTTIQPWNEQRTGDFSSYHDPRSQAAILAFPERSSDGSIKNTYHGIFRHNNQDYSFQPTTTSRRKRRSSSQYVVQPIKPLQTQFGSEMAAKNPIPNMGDLKLYLNDSVQQKLNYVVELFMLIDYEIYNNWYTLSTKQSPQDKYNDAINGIRYYYAQVVNGMDLRYSNINVSDFTIRVKLVGYYIATNQSASPWTEGPSVRSVYNNQVYTDAYQALEILPPWILANKNNLPSFDNVMLFTGNYMKGGNNNDGSPIPISGLANIQALCNQLAVSICHENGDFASSVTGAHELAHNLGSYHDGQQNLCSANDQFIMAPAPGQLTSSTFLHPYNFSACSIDYMRSYLGGLSLMNMNCLLQTQTPTADPNVPSIPMNTPLGQFITIDRQCQHLYGAGSHYCGGSINDQLMCSQLVCLDPRVGRCVSNTQLRAANGTTCGYKKWCILGTCTYDIRAPVASDTCLSGDYQGDLLDCKSQIGNNPGLCYQSYYNATCCTSCQAISDQKRKKYRLRLCVDTAALRSWIVH